MKRTLFGVLAIGISAIAPAQFFDDFNRPDAPNLGPNWTGIALVVQVISNQAINGGPISGLATANPYTDTYQIAIVSVDAFAGAGPDYVGVVSGFAGTGNNQALFGSIADNDGNGIFETVNLYTGNNFAGGAAFRSHWQPRRRRRGSLCSRRPRTPSHSRSTTTSSQASRRCSRGRASRALPEGSARASGSDSSGTRAPTTLTHSRFQSLHPGRPSQSAQRPSWHAGEGAPARKSAS